MILFIKSPPLNINLVSMHLAGLKEGSDHDRASKLRVQTNGFNFIPPFGRLMFRKSCIRSLFIFSGVSGGTIKAELEQKHFISR